MSSNDVIGGAVGYAIGAGGFLLIAGLRRSFWARQAHKLAMRADIELPDRLIGRVSRFVRAQYLLGLPPGLVLYVSMTALLTADGGQRHWVTWFPWTLAVLPVLLAVYSYAVTVWPRWKASGTARITHLGRVSPRQAFTRTELVVVAGCAILGAVGAGWGLSRVSASGVWWVICLAAFGVSTGVSWHLAQAIMNRPSSASDTVELGWHDVLRFQQARAVMIGAAWVPALLVFLLDDQLSFELGKMQTVEFWPAYLVFAAGGVLLLVFRQGRHLWRQAWAPLARPPTP